MTADVLRLPPCRCAVCRGDGLAYDHDQAEYERWKDREDDARADRGADA